MSTAVLNPSPSRPLASPDFLGLVATQFLGAFNDNMYRWLAVYAGIETLAQAAGGNVTPEQRASLQGTALAIGAVLFLLPFVVLAAPAAYLGDRFSKVRVMRATKWAEIVIMALGSVALLTGNVTLLFVVLFCMGAQSTLFGPARLGAIPEIVGTDALPTANGIANLSGMIAIILGTFTGHFLWDVVRPGGWLPGTNGILVASAALMGVAVLGTATSYLMRPGPAGDPARQFPWNPFAETWRDFRLVAADRVLFRVTLAIAFFWMLGSFAQQNILIYADRELGLTSATQGGVLQICLALGVGIGSVMAGIWSRGRVQMGFVPLAAFGLVLNAALLWTSTDSFVWTCIWLYWLGFFGGVYDVPLTAYLQKNSPEASRGSVFALSNCISFSAMILISIVFRGLVGAPPTGLGLSPGAVFLVAAAGTLPVAIYMFTVVPRDTAKLVLWGLVRIFYRVRIRGAEHFPDKGGVLIVSNHVSWVDALMIGGASPRVVRFIAYDANMHLPGIRVFSWFFNTILINASDGPKALLRSLQTASQALRDGDVVCIFAEGGITRTGQTLAFQRGLLKILDKTDAVVVPAYLDGLWGSVLSFSEGKFFKKKPKRWPYPVRVVFGPPLRDPRSTHQVRQAVLEQGAAAMELRKQTQQVLPRRFLRQCRLSANRTKIVDSTGQKLTGRDLLLRTAVLRRILARHLAADEKMVGVLLPPSAGGALTNIALTTLRRVTVNLNYTVSERDLQTHVELCGIKHVVTSKAFLDKIKFNLPVQYILLEDLKAEATRNDKLAAAWAAYVAPLPILERQWGLTSIKPDDLLTVIFTSGSTGEPKGVMLSYNNVSSNVEAIDELFNLKPTDVLLGTLPFFHSFGYTGTLWPILCLNPEGAYHFNPLDARVVGKLCQDEKVTILMSTPTFLRSYIKRCDKEQFDALNLVITGAEKLPAELADAFQEKFGVRPMEGYGCTELSPLAAVNVADHRSPGVEQIGQRPGTVGRPVPGVLARVVHPDTGEELGVDQPGMLLIKGPNVMQGYLSRPDKTAEVVHDGWYTTGDIAQIDSDGFVQITGRQSRFSKIGGEMVPHLKIEEILCHILARTDEEANELQAVVTAVPDERKGERLIVLHRPLSKPVDQVCKELSESGLPNLWIPSSDSFIEVAEIPVLGTGKLDLKRLKQLALEKTQTAV